MRGGGKDGQRRWRVKDIFKKLYEAKYEVQEKKHEEENEGL